MHVWDDILTPEEREVVEIGGFGTASRVGTRPSLLVIDMQNRFLGLKAPLVESVKTYPASIGERAWATVPRVKALCEAARAARIPIIYTQLLKVPRKEGSNQVDLGVEGARIKRAGGALPSTEDPEWGPQIIRDLLPGKDGEEIVLEKNYASAFYATPLLNYLVRFGTDTLILTGITTAGCIRATAVDASSMNYGVIVVEDCVADRCQASHKASLFDVWCRYGDVWGSHQVVEYLTQLPAGAPDSQKPSKAAEVTSQ
jgi:nicotinamidase-related amidase